MITRIKWKAVLLELASDRGTLVASGLTSVSCPGLFVHEGHNAKSGYSWFVTHILSGKALSWDWISLEDAQKMALELSMSGLNWDVSEEEIVADPKYKEVLRSSETELLSSGKAEKYATRKN